MWGAIIGTAVSVIGGGISASKGRRKLKDLNDANASLISQQSLEEERRLKNEMEQTEALAGAMSAASGVETSGSRKISIDTTKRENKAQLDWLRKSNRQKALTVAAGGQIQTSQLKTQAVMSGVQGFARIADSLFSNPKGSGKT